MKLKYFVVVVVSSLCIFIPQFVRAQGSNSTSPYCFEFTWLGPTYDNSSTFNTSCEEHLDDIRAVGVPCSDPFVITYDATLPDIDYIWENYPTIATCRQARGYVCAKFSYTFANVIQNITYMCTQAYSVDEGALTSGCYTQKLDAYDVEVCLCESRAGYIPCNDATSARMSILLLIIAVIGVIGNYVFNH